MSGFIDILNEYEAPLEEEQHLIEKVLQYAAKHLRLERDFECSVTLVDNERIQELNRTYRDKDQATDCLSFPIEDEDEEWVFDEETDAPPLMLGDLIISIPKAKEQAESYGHSFQRELAFLTIHGFLHLLGFDHETEQGEKEMFAKQEEILTAYGLPRT
ncbi:rRNA maturation RNase YbeY [Bacillus fonticola]|uniref:rRNA maturation RNase YbeY n=1 Tax=Bacillus fonticola TaxID=2728853 RepID=UPI001472DBF6|nr:rRNA maturation RNase YbeY [Bacillus fonticola]